MITREDIALAVPTYEAKLDESFFRVRLDRATEMERIYLRAMAELGSEAQRARDVAAVIGRKSTQMGPTRAQLINRACSTPPSTVTPRLPCRTSTSSSFGPSPTSSCRQNVRNGPGPRTDPPRAKNLRRPPALPARTSGATLDHESAALQATSTSMKPRSTTNAGTP